MRWERGNRRDGQTETGSEETETGDGDGDETGDGDVDGSRRVSRRGLDGVDGDGVRLS